MPVRPGAGDGVEAWFGAGADKSRLTADLRRAEATLAMLAALVGDGGGGKTGKTSADGVSGNPSRSCSLACGVVSRDAGPVLEL